ncbi:hypothetical protein D0Z07_7024 [Hyphodiscus hymeniophilus]|uniref:DUF1857-domain-containing protein n=1 Tax=Hyphodiscus hymeniophilus TaxID=353542 RepID=A0A9P6VGP4_9HELO|nr:hypothetical protein D0Z07_7024 [Hyphodiscus hymeniophilus]
MTILYAAATVPINLPGVTPVLKLDQVWAALELKRKQPQLFLAVIDTCEVLSDDGETVVREVKFKDSTKIALSPLHNPQLTVTGDGNGKAPVIGPKVQEQITHIKPISAQANSGLETFETIGTAKGSRVLNIVSEGTTPDELYLTFTFEWDHPEIEADSKEAIAKQKEYQTAAPKAVAGTVAKTREYVTAGKL